MRVEGVIRTEPLCHDCHKAGLHQMLGIRTRARTREVSFSDATTRLPRRWLQQRTYGAHYPESGLAHQAHGRRGSSGAYHPHLGETAFVAVMILNYYIMTDTVTYVRSRSMQRGNAEMYRRSGPVSLSSREQGMSFHAGCSVSKIV